MSTQESNIVRYHTLFAGRVQGVGFRWQVMAMATELGLTGTIKNREDGQVEAYFQGSKEKVLQVIQKIRSLGPIVRVDDYRIKEVPTVKEKDFRVVY